MIVHVVTESFPYDGSTTLGVFSDLEEANRFASEGEFRFVEEFVVNDAVPARLPTDARLWPV